jgi:hypothetical protein
MRCAVRLGCGRRFLCVVAVLVASLLTVLLAQASEGVTHTGAHVRIAVAAVVDVRALARERPEPEPASGETEEAVLEPQEKAEPNVRMTVPSPSAALLQAPASKSAAPSPYVSASFLAQADLPPVGSTKTESPPDTNGAVGRQKLMVPLNSNYVIQRKSDGKVLSRVSMTAFWRAVGAHNPFDPRVLYDPYSDRWLVTAADDPLLPSSLILYGISETGDPQGRWRLYALDADAANATWADFPTLGFNRSTVVIGVNMFSTGTLNYARGRLVVLDYAALRAGGSGTPTDVTIPGGFALQPAVTYSPSEPTLYLVEHLSSDSATYRFWALQGKTLTLVGGVPKTNHSARGAPRARRTCCRSRTGAGSTRATPASETPSSATGTSTTPRRSRCLPAERGSASTPPSSGSSSTGAATSRADGSRTRGPTPGTAVTPTRSRRSP